MPLILCFLLHGAPAPTPLPALAPARAEALGPTGPRLERSAPPERRALLRTGVRVVAAGENAAPRERPKTPSLP